MELYRKNKAVRIAVAVSIGVAAVIIVKKMFYDDQTRSDSNTDRSDKTKKEENEENKENVIEREENKEANDEKEKEYKKDSEDKEEKEIKVEIKKEIKKKEIKKEIKSKTISITDVLLLVNGKGDNYVIIDVRDPKIDFVGGHIAKSVNISSDTFYDKLPEIFAKYHNKSIFIVQCMYGAHRSVECIGFYKKAINEIIKNYSKENGSSFYNKYSKENGKTTSTKIDIKCDELMYNNLSKQKLYMVDEGFFSFINDKKVDKKNENVISDFDDNQWTELTILNEKKLYHKKEFFQQNKFAQPGKPGSNKDI